MSDNKKPLNRRQWVVAKGKVTINVTEFFGVIPKFSYQLGRTNHEGRFVPFLSHEMIDEAFTVLREVVDQNTATIKRAEDVRAAAVAAHKEQENKRIGKKGKKELQRLENNRVPSHEDLMREADRRSEREKKKNQESWPGHIGIKETSDA